MLPNDGVGVPQNPETAIVLQHGFHWHLLVLIKLKLDLVGQHHRLLVVGLCGPVEGADFGSRNHGWHQTLTFTEDPAQKRVSGIQWISKEIW